MKFFKSQITKLKSETNLRIQYIKSIRLKHFWVIGAWDLDIVCLLLFGAWNLLNSMTPLFLDT